VFEDAIANLSPYAGYTVANQVFEIPRSFGDNIYTAQLRASGLAGGLAVDTERSRGPLIDILVVDIDHEPPAIPIFNYTPGFTVFVPEPSAFALVGLGAVILVCARRMGSKQSRLPIKALE
jgi:hypothetical protein